MSESNNALTLMEQFPPDQLEIFKEILNYDLETSFVRTLRFPRIKVGHSNQSFLLPNNNVVTELNGVILAKAAFMEYFPQKDNSTDDPVFPECVAINNFIGSKYGPCVHCPKYVWVEDKGRECSSAYRVLLRLREISTPVELKIPQTSIKSFNDAIKPIMAQGIPLVFTNVKITLSSKKEGQQEWSLFHFEIEVPNYNLKDPEDLAKLEKRKELFLEHKDYFVKSYGLPSSYENSGDAKQPKESKQSMENKAENVEILDEVIEEKTEEIETTEGTEGLEGLVF